MPGVQTGSAVGDTSTQPDHTVDDNLRDAKTKKVGAATSMRKLASITLPQKSVEELKPKVKKRHDSDEQDVSIVELRPPAPTSSPSSQEALLSGWSTSKENGRIHHRGPDGDHLIDDGRSIKGTSGSANEVDAMFAIARSQNWKSMAFTGTDDFKRRVMETALKNNYQVAAFGKDAELLAQVRRRLAPESPDRSLSVTGSPDIPKVKQENTNASLSGDLAKDVPKQKASEALKLPALSLEAERLCTQRNATPLEETQNKKLVLNKK